uniref:Uncharacterized protein n=1 Tax=Glossina palpalis gambiensis TaxID=67801 RepID=A0A1B0C1G1_9MUSC
RETITTTFDSDGILLNVPPTPTSVLLPAVTYQAGSVQLFISFSMLGLDFIIKITTCNLFYTLLSSNSIRLKNISKLSKIIVWLRHVCCRQRQKAIPDAHHVVRHLYLLVLTEVLNESEELKSSHKDIEALSKSIVTFLGEVHQPSAEAIQAKLDNLVQQQSNHFKCY